MKIKLKKEKIFFVMLIFILNLFLLNFLTISICFADENRKVIINKIKIIIDENIYNWDKPDLIPEKDKINYTSPKTVISFLYVKPGEILFIKKLEEKLFESERRLNQSGFFISVKTYWVFSTSDETRVNVIIEVKEGFLSRFGGGAIFVVVGKDNLFGLRKSLYGFLGYNLIGFDYKDEIFLDSNFIFGLKLLYQNSYGFSEISFNKIDLNNIFGYRFSPSSSLKLFSYIRYQDSQILDIYNHLFFYNGKFFTLNEKLIFNSNFYKGNLEFYYRGMLEFSPGIFYYYPLYQDQNNYFNKIIFNLETKILFVIETKLFSFGFCSNLFYISNPLDYIDSYNISFPGYSFVRTNIAIYQKFPDAVFVTNIELRSKFFNLFLGGIFNLAFSFFIFDDIAFSKILYKNISNLPYELTSDEVFINNGFYILNAIGFGLRFGFDIPINVFFTLAIGWNLNGNYSIIFYYGKGF